MGFNIGPLFVRYYGMILMFGVVAAAFLADREARRRRFNPEFVWDGLIWVVVGGVIGARIWHVLTPPPSMVEQGITTQFYLTHPLDALAIWRGGLGIPGAVIGGGLMLFWFTRRQKVSFAAWVDIVAPGLALGQAIGRWGNYINQELYGAPTNLPWAIEIDPQYRLPGFESIARYHPIFLYESLWNLANMALLLWLGRRYGKRLRDGDLFLIYLVVYPIGRALIDFLRLDPSMVAGINANQTLMVITAVVSLAALLWRHRDDRKPAKESHRRRRKASR